MAASRRNGFCFTGRLCEGSTLFTEDIHKTNKLQQYRSHPRHVCEATLTGMQLEAQCCQHFGANFVHCQQTANDSLHKILVTESTERIKTTGCELYNYLHGRVKRRRAGTAQYIHRLDTGWRGVGIRVPVIVRFFYFASRPAGAHPAFYMTGSGIKWPERQTDH